MVPAVLCADQLLLPAADDVVVAAVVVVGRFSYKIKLI